jgi:hypothetical protein
LDLRFSQGVRHLRAARLPVVSNGETWLSDVLNVNFVSHDWTATIYQGCLPV